MQFKSLQYAHEKVESGEINFNNLTQYIKYF